MKFQHPTIEIQTPAPGHYVIIGHQPTSTFVEGVGHVVPSQECYISPQVPSEALVAVLEDRGDFKGEDPFEAIRAEIPIEVPADSPDEITAAVKGAFDENDKLRSRVKELEDERSKDFTEQAKFLEESRKCEKERDELRAELDKLNSPEEVELRAEASGKKATEKLAGEMYDAYCEAVGGQAFNGDPLPVWKEFRADEKKTKQSDAWVAAAQAAIGGKK